jgi:hypothetical protein
MRYLGLALIWIGIFVFVAGVGVVITDEILTTIAYLDFVHEFVFYGLSAAVGAFTASWIVRRVSQLQSVPASSAPNEHS